MASLRFHKVSSLPASCALGDVYYVVGKGIYVCTKEASSGATESANYTRFSYANDAASGVKGVTSLSDATNSTSSTVAATSTAVKAAYDRGSKGVNDAANALSVANSKWAQKTATQASGGTAVEGTVKGHFADKTGFSVSPIIDGVVYYKDTNTHNSHAHTFTVSDTTSTNGTATSVDVVSSIGNAAKSSGDLSSTYAKVSVPTLKVTNDLASEISKLKTVNTTGMQYKGTRTDGTVPSAGKVGDVYKVTTKAISGVGAEVGDFIVCNTATSSATDSAWDVWQANVNKDAYWDTNTPVSGNFVVADGTTGKIKDSGYNFGSFALSSHNHASSAINAMTGYAKASASAAIATTDSLNAAIGKLECKVDTTQTSLSNHINNTGNPHGVTASQVGLGNVTNNRQVVGLSSGTTEGHFVTWGADGYTVADSGKSASSFDAAGTASSLINTLRGGYTDTLQSVANAASAAQTTAEAREPKSTAVRHAAGKAAGSATQPVYVASDGTATACTYTLGKSVPSDAVFTDTHHTYAFTITNGTTTATSFTQNAAASLAIKASASGNLTASTSAGSGTLTVNVGVASGYAIPTTAKATEWDKKWDAVNATTSSKGIASFNSSNFDVTNGAVSLAWAEFV